MLHHYGRGHMMTLSVEQE